MLNVTYQMIRDAAATAKAEAEKLKNQPLLAAIIELQGFAFELQAENEELKRERDQKASMTFRDRVYWNDADPKNPGPFCPACWGSGKLVAMYSHDRDEFRRCPGCTVCIPIPGAERSEPRYIQPRDPI